MLEFLYPGRKWAKISEAIDDRENMMSGPPTRNRDPRQREEVIRTLMACCKQKFLL